MNTKGFISGCVCLIAVIALTMYVLFMADVGSIKYVHDNEYMFVNQNITWEGAGYSGVYSNTKGGYYGR